MAALVAMIVFHITAQETPWEERVERQRQATLNVAREILADMVVVDGGTFAMGNEQGYPDEKPVHNVTVGSFAIGRHEITQAQWLAVMGNDPSHHVGANGLPVDNVSWDDCIKFIEALNEATGLRFRLPTEAEWEFAARGGKNSHGTRFAGSNDGDGVAWHNGNAQSSQPVGSKAANEIGLYDMSGNLWEWCADWYGEDYYSASNGAVNPTGPAEGEYHIVRGGSWYRSTVCMQVSYREKHAAWLAYDDVGVRLALTIEGNTLPTISATPLPPAITRPEPEIIENVIKHQPVSTSESKQQSMPTPESKQQPVSTPKPQPAPSQRPATQQPSQPSRQNPERTTAATQQATSALPAPIAKLIGDMVRIDGGTFQMGNMNGYADERPVHQVGVGTFLIGRYEVTQSQWSAVMGNNPSEFKGDNLPVENVSWENCAAFISKLNAMTGKQFRLPTEAEWEYAARGGRRSNGFTYSGDDNVDGVACINDSHTQPVGTKWPNELGLYDMSGNVWEWCSDLYAEGYYASSPAKNPTGPATGEYRMMRGGSWSRGAVCARVTYRDKHAPTLAYNDVGLRLALSVEGNTPSAQPSHGQTQHRRDNASPASGDRNSGRADASPVRGDRNLGRGGAEGGTPAQAQSPHSPVGATAAAATGAAVTTAATSAGGQRPTVNTSPSPYESSSRKTAKKEPLPERLDEAKWPEPVKQLVADMVTINGGSFMMGSDDADADIHEHPAHNVTLSTFSIAKHEVTQALWRAVMNNNPSAVKGDNLPVTNVSWDDCELFIARLNAITGRSFRLPTEAEWEYAARGGDKDVQGKYAGNDNIHGVAWHNDNSTGTVHDVGTKEANELGLFDMSGNVGEWCADFYSGTYYRTSPANNPKCTDEGPSRVFRGGNWNSSAKDCRVSARARFSHNNARAGLGLRLASD